MGFDDILRDTGNLSKRGTINTPNDLAAQREKLADRTEAELWAIHVAMGSMNAEGLAALALLKERCPEKFTPEQLRR